MYGWFDAWHFWGWFDAWHFWGWFDAWHFWGAIFGVGVVWHFTTTFLNMASYFDGYSWYMVVHDSWTCWAWPVYWTQCLWRRTTLPNLIRKKSYYKIKWWWCKFICESLLPSYCTVYSHAQSISKDSHIGGFATCVVPSAACTYV